MSKLERDALLPTGLRDVLPPDAAFEADVVARLLASFEANGYQRIRPPLIEFEEGLLSGAGAAMAAETFRLMDPESRRMMGVRADITPQIARIALTRLGSAPRPLRLSYAGEGLRGRGSQLRPQRQLTQVGAELVGSAAPAADAEIITLAADALAGLGIAGLSVDLTVPRLVPAVCAATGVADETMAGLRRALDHKDAPAVAACAGAAAATLGELLAATGPAEAALARLDALDLPALAATERTRLAQVMALIRARSPDLKLTLDPVENRGFEYHTGIGFTVFADGVRGELGSGGRYRAKAGDDSADAGGDDAGERATGVTLYTETLLGSLALPAGRRRLYVPVAEAAEGARMRDDGWITVAGFETVADTRAEARRLGCGHVLVDGNPVAAEHDREG